MDFDWDPAKDAANRDGHGIAFEEATAVWLDPHVVLVPTLRERDGEPRYKAIGMIGGRLFTVVYVDRDGITRLISARRANRQEKRTYG